jgi:pyrroline-5-carboxylate reductase
MVVKPSILLVGGGNMGRSLLNAWRKNDLVGDVTVIDPYPVPELQKLARVMTDLSQLDKAEKFDVVVLAVKPQTAEEIMSKLVPFVTHDNFFLSIVAGKNVQFYQRYLGHKPIIRSMPNTPCQIGQGVTGLYATQETSLETGDIAEKLFEPTGVIFWIDEERDMHDITAISGSGPGFVFYLMEVLEKDLGRDGAIQAALYPEENSPAYMFFKNYLEASLARNIADPETTEAVVKQIFKGSALLARSDGSKSFVDLRQAVTSPKGTTEAGLDVLMQSDEDLAARVEATLAAASRRSRELA